MSVSMYESMPALPSSAWIRAHSFQSKPASLSHWKS